MTSTQNKQWEQCLAFIRDNLHSQEQFAAWFEPLTFLGYEDNQLLLFAPSEYFIDQLETRYEAVIKSAVRRAYGNDTRLVYRYKVVENDPSTEVTVGSSNASPAVKPLLNAQSNPFYSGQEAEFIESQLNPRYTFENYCESPSNRVARSFGIAIADNPSIKTFNPLFVFGPSGVGKTHLIQAIGIRIKERNPGARVIYLTARLFESLFTTAHLRGRLNDFIHFFQGVDTLIIDDIQDLIGRAPKTQNAFFHIFNHLHLNQRQIILSSDCRPAAMEGLENRLLSRFKWGATAELQRPDLELRRDILTLKARQDGLNIPSEVMDFIAANVTDSVRELEGVVVSLLAHATILNREIDLDLARNVMANAVRLRTRQRQVNFEMITQQVSAYYNIDPEALFTKTRKREISDARQMVMFMAKKHAHMPLAAIGTRLSRTHATVLYACRNIEERLPLEKQLQQDVAKIEESLLK